MKKLRFLTAIAALLVLVFTACHDHDEAEYAEKGSIEIEFDHKAGTDALIFGKYYVTDAGDSIQFSTFDYFVSNIVLVKEDGSEYIVPKNDSYFLVKHATADSRTLKLSNIPGGAYTSVRFIVGIDSLMSATPAEQRPTVLDPVINAADMYWAWNSGYIFVKIEGTSPQAPLNANTQEHSVIYHVGGYGGNDPASPTMNNIKTVTLAKAGEIAQVGQLSGSDHSHGTEGVVPHFHTYVDVLEVFKTPNSFKVADNPIMHWGDFSITLANNYKDMFSLDHIHN